jgi:catechol 2,3-dioxygenase-like lactoylglutathione lyase family enzyme
VLGKTLVAFVRADKAQPSAGSVIDHIAVSYPDVNARLKSLDGSGATIVTTPGDAPGPFTSRFIEDPWGVRIELLQDPDRVGFHHVHLRVADPAATLRWYHEAFGGEPSRLNGRVDGVRFGPVWLFAEKSSVTPAPSAERAIQNVAWEVVDVDEAATALKARGVKVVIEPRFAGAVRYAFFEDPNGVRVELLQRPRP